MRRNAFHSDPYHRPAHMLYVPAVMLHSMQLQLHSGMILSHPMILCPVENSTQLEIASRCASSQGTAATARISRGGRHWSTGFSLESAGCVAPNAECSTMQGLQTIKLQGNCLARQPTAASTASQTTSPEQYFQWPLTIIFELGRGDADGHAHQHGQKDY